jgi:hypothetical protein
MTKLVNISKGAGGDFRGSWVNPDDIASVVLFNSGRCRMRLRHVEGEIDTHIDDVEKFERDLGLAAESEPDVEQVPRLVRSLGEYCQTYCSEYYAAVGTVERGIKAVLDLANVKYREG